MSGQAGALRLGIARALIDARPRAADHPQAGRPPHPGRPREGEQEVRPEEGPQGAAVLQAVAGWPQGSLRHRRRPGGGQRGADGRAGARPRTGRRTGAARLRPTWSAGTPGARGPSCRRPSRPVWPPRGSTWSTWACCPPPAWPGAPSAGACPAAVISASHNPFEDNGIKLFGAGRHQADGRDGDGHRGRTLADRRRAAGPTGGRPWAASRPTPTGAADYARPPGGRPRRSPARRAARRARLRQRRGQRRSPRLVFAGLGAAVTSMALPARRDEHQRRLRLDPSPGAGRGGGRAAGADLGLAFDGDADRLVAVDHTGAVVDGDTLLALFAVDLAARGELAGDAVVVTVMTNLGLPPGHGRAGHRRARDAGGRPPRAGRARGRGPRAGGRAVRPHRLPPPGHHRRRDPDRPGRWPTWWCGPGRPLAELSAGLVERVPQVLVNVAVADPGPARAGAEVVWRRWPRPRPSSASTGRVVLRPSGTEPVVRVMVEAVDSGPGGQETAARLSPSAVEEALGAVAARRAR